MRCRLILLAAFLAYTVSPVISMPTPAQVANQSSTQEKMPNEPRMLHETKAKRDNTAATDPNNPGVVDSSLLLLDHLGLSGRIFLDSLAKLQT